MVHQQLQATTATHTAQLNVLAEGFQQDHLIVQNAHAAVANASAARLPDTAQSISVPALPRAPAPAVADMSMEPDQTPTAIISATRSIPAFTLTLARKTQVCGYFKCQHCFKLIRTLPRNKAFGW